MNKKQILVTISREFGSQGHKVADLLARKLDIPLLDREILHKMVERHGFDHATIAKYDEKRRNYFLSRSVYGHSNSIEDVFAKMVFDYITELADIGESFVLVGRCGDEILKGREGLVRVFVSGDEDVKLRHLMERYNWSEKEAFTQMKKIDNRRRHYHDYHASTKWRQANAYDLCVNSSKLGIEGTADLIYGYVKLLENR
ncbi:MAG: cytidylate kinase-like family protein [Ruminococcaceae bacterium]|nr:cytidylate kinase-like family protein [Oscillospiraceae bacterium]